MCPEKRCDVVFSCTGVAPILTVLVMPFDVGVVCVANFADASRVFVKQYIGRFSSHHPPLSTTNVLVLRTVLS